MCSSAAGFAKSYIKANFSSIYVNVNKSITFSSLDGGDSLDIEFAPNSYVKLFPKDFEGNQLSSYGQLLMMTVKYADVDSLNATWNVTIKNTNGQAAHFDIVPEPSLSNDEYHARLHEHYTLNNLTAYELQSILVDLDFVQIHGSFMANGSVSIKVKLVTATKGVGEEVGYVENCTCPNNYTELSCGYCNSGKV